LPDLSSLLYVAISFANEIEFSVDYGHAVRVILPVAAAAAGS